MGRRRNPVRGLVLLILDTLRADFDTLVPGGLAALPGFGGLRALCDLFPAARCGSFPTGPMRTDLLTGRLAFLHEEWALPQPSEQTLLSIARADGMRAALVSDNYVAVVPQLGGMLLGQFDTLDFIRGAGSDPWMPWSSELRHEGIKSDPGRPTRSLKFEIQYLANRAQWAGAGGPPTRRLFHSARRQLAMLGSPRRALLWVDSFACHEPWDSWSEPPASALPELPLFPAYGEAERFAPGAIEEWKRQYVQRLRDVDVEMRPFVEELTHQMRGGDVALAVLSDHGFLFGECGFVGKAPNTPLPPALHDIVCWLSPHFRQVIPGDRAEIQPHDLFAIILGVLGLGGARQFSPGLQVFGRNSPRSAYIASAADGELHVGAKAEDGTAVFHTIERSAFDERVPMAQQGRPGLRPAVRQRLERILAAGPSPWLDPFRRRLIEER